MRPTHRDLRGLLALALVACVLLGACDDEVVVVQQAAPAPVPDAVESAPRVADEVFAPADADVGSGAGGSALNRYVHRRVATERAVRLDARGLELPPGAVQRLGRTELRHDGRIHDLLHTPDGSTVVSAGDEGRVEFWDAASGARVRPALLHPAAVRAVAIARATPDRVVTAADDGVLRVFELPDDAAHTALDLELGPLAALALAPDGRLAAAGGADSAIRLVTLEPEPSAAAAPTPDGDGPVPGDTATPPGTVPPADAVSPTDAVPPRTVPPADTVPPRDATRGAEPPTGSTAAPAWETLAGHDAALQALAFSPDGRLLASLDEAGTLLLWEVASRSVRTRLDGLTAAGRHRVVWSADGSRLAVSGDTVQLIDPATGEDLLDLAGDHPLQVSDVAFLDAAGGALVSSHEHALRRWDAHTGAALGPALDTGLAGTITALSFGGSPPRLALAQERAVVFVELESDRLVLGPGGHTTDLAALASSAALTAPPTLASAARDGSVLVWRADAGDPVLRLALPAAASDLVLDPGGRYLAAAAPLDVPRLFRLPEGTPWHVLEGQPHVARLAVLDGGRVLALGAADRGRVDLVDVESGALLRSLALGAEPIAALAAGPRTRRFAAATTGGRVLVFHLDTVLAPAEAAPAERRRGDAADLALASLVLEPGERGTPSALAFSPDGATLAVASRSALLDGGSVALWRLEAPAAEEAGAATEPLAQLDRIAAASLVYSPDGGILVAGLADGRAALLEAATLTRRFTLEGHGRALEALAVVPGTDLLATGSRDTTVLVWDLAPLRTFVAPYQAAEAAASKPPPAPGAKPPATPEEAAP